MTEGLRDTFQTAEDRPAERLKSIRRAGKPVAKIDSALGAPTKDRAIGWAHKLDLSPRPNASQPSMWTSRRVFQLKGYMAAGLTPAEIAKELGDVSEELVRGAIRTVRAGGRIKVTDFEWTEEHEAALRGLWLDGVGTRAIAARMGVTDNMISAQVDRMRKRGIHMPYRSTNPPKQGGLKQTDFTNEQDRIGNELKAKRKARALEPSKDEAAIADNLPPTDKPFVSDGCRWPVGDPRAINSPAFGTFRYCQQKIAHGPYCSDHDRLSRSKDVKPTHEAAPRARHGSFANGWVS